MRVSFYDSTPDRLITSKGDFQIFQELVDEAKHHLFGSYPKFVHDAKPQPLDGEIPVFVYHSIDPDEFEAHLRYLTENGYQTIDCDTYLAILKGEQIAHPRSVMLTIDDGRSSVLSAAYPLLKKYQMQAVVFLIPGYIRAGTDFGATQVDLGGHPDRDPDLMTWAEIAEIAQSGVIDFQSHTHFHHRVPVSDQLLGFVTPQTKTGLFDIPVAPGDEPDPETAETALWGYPIFKSASRMSGQPAFLPDPSLIQDLLGTVAKQGETFFQQSDWQQRLKDMVEDRRQHKTGLGRFETTEETEKAIQHSLEVSKQQIESRIPGKTVRHLCLPYTIGSQMAVTVAKRVGYESCFWGVLSDRRCNHAGDDPMHSARLKGDFLPRLPGKHRVSIPHIVIRKVKRRLSGAPVY